LLESKQLKRIPAPNADHVSVDRAALSDTAVDQGSERRGWLAVWLAFGTWVLYPAIALVRDLGYRPPPGILIPLVAAALAVVGAGLSVLCLGRKSSRRLGILGLIMNGLTVLTNGLALVVFARIPAA
jgi:hypothetical protein